MDFLLATGVISYPQIDPIIVELGPLALRWYSMAYIGGILFAWWYIRRVTREPSAPMTATHIDDFVTWAMIAIIAGGRLGYVLFYNFEAYLNEPVAIFRLWDGGMSFHGGLTGVIIAIFLFVRKHKLDLLRVGDVAAVVSPIGLLAGRVANFINGELWGRQTDVSWAMIFPADPLGVPRHPSQLYEALGEGIILFLILHGLYKYTRLPKAQPGVIAALFFFGYGIARFTVEFFREPDAHLGLMEIGISRGQLLTVPMFLFGGWLLFQSFKKRPNVRA